MVKKNFLIVIPARLASTRLPNKPLIDIEGKCMLERTFEKCSQAVSRDLIYVATDSELIYNFCKSKSINVEMTSEHCLTGTDRLAEFALKHKVDYYINVQGDEPLINPKDIITVIDSIDKYNGEIINCYTEILDSEQYFSLSIPKVVFDNTRKLLYMSRSPVPGNKSGVFRKAWRQVCIYAFPSSSLRKFSTINSKTMLENEEDIEILRFLEMGCFVRMVEVSGISIAVDTEFDLNLVRKLVRESNKK